MNILELLFCATLFGLCRDDDVDLITVNILYNIICNLYLIYNHTTLVHEVTHKQMDMLGIKC